MFSIFVSDSDPSFGPNNLYKIEYFLLTKIIQIQRDPLPFRKQIGFFQFFDALAMEMLPMLVLEFAAAPSLVQVVLTPAAILAQFVPSLAGTCRRQDSRVAVVGSAQHLVSTPSAPCPLCSIPVIYPNHCQEASKLLGQLQP